MAFSTKATITLTLLALAELVAGHGAIIAAVGDAGGSGMALGVDTSTPRDGTRRRPFQQDSTRFRGASADTFGETLAGGDNRMSNSLLFCSCCSPFRPTTKLERSN